MAFKCHLCRKVYMNNVEFMKHLSLHVESDRASAVDLSDLCQCKYCFRDFDTPFAMQNHLEEAHWKKGFDHICRICEMGFKVRQLPTVPCKSARVRWRKPGAVHSFACVLHTYVFCISVTFVQTTSALTSHMNTYHVAAEMPYGCNICGFRCSFHKDIIDHFQVRLHHVTSTRPLDHGPVYLGPADWADPSHNHFKFLELRDEVMISSTYERNHFLKISA